MLRLSAFLFLLPLFLFAENRWIEVRSGPLDVLCDSGDRPARAVTNQLEQIRWALGTALGNQNLKTVWPVRILTIENGPAQPPALVRNNYIASIAAGAPVPREWLRAYIALLVESNAGRMSEKIESGLEDFYSLAQVAGTKITLGEPPPAGERTLDWARISLLQIDPNYSGRLRVLLYNLQQGADSAPAFRNAFGKTEPEIDAIARANLASNNFPADVIGGRALDPRRDLFVREAPGPLAAIARADLEFARSSGRSAYENLLTSAPAEAHEGLALIYLREGKTAEAQRELAAAIEAGTQSARAYCEQAKLDPDKTKTIPLLEKAVALNPNWAAPHAFFASRIVNPDKKLQELSSAAKLEPRNAANWRALAGEYVKQHKYPDALKAWAAAERAAASDAERAAIREESRDLGARRLEFEQADRQRAEQEKQRALQQVKDASMAEIHAAEERANQGQPAPPPNRKIVQWQNGPEPTAKVRGRLVRVECLRGATRLTVESADGKLTRLAIHDTGHVTVNDVNELALGCAAPATPRQVTIGYVPKSDAKLGTAGEAATIDFA
ncbi:MAG: hypothetical protein ABSG25_14625, partial [Bryobacteraceae bacterium]